MTSPGHLVSAIVDEELDNLQVTLHGCEVKAGVGILVFLVQSFVLGRLQDQNARTTNSDVDLVSKRQIYN